MVKPTALDRERERHLPVVEMAPASRAVSGYDSSEHRQERPLIDRVTLVDLERLRRGVAITLVDDLVRICNMRVVYKQVDVIFGRQQRADVAVEHEVRLNRTLNRLLNLRISGMDQIAEITTELGLPIRKPIDEYVDTTIWNRHRSTVGALLAATTATTARDRRFEIAVCGMLVRVRSAARVTVERGSANASGMWGHVLAVRQGTRGNASEAFIPIEIGLAALIVVAADIYVLAVSGHFPTAARDTVRVIGVLVAAGILLWLGLLVFAFAIAGVFLSLVRDVGGDRSVGRGGLWIVPVCAVGLAVGSADGALVALYGPIAFGSIVLAAALAVGLRRSGFYRRPEHAAASLGLLFLCSYVVSGLVVGAIILR